jgi:hypothetical protein
MGKCPKCQQVVSRVMVVGIDGDDTIAGRTWKVVTYSCASCSTVLGVEMDPLAVKSDIAAEITDRLLRMRG